MNIPETFQKIKHGASLPSRDLFVILLITVVGIGSFGLGRLSLISEMKTKTDVTIEYPPLVDSPEYKERVRLAWEEGTGKMLDKPDPENIPDSQKTYIASKNGTKYYLVNCSGVNRIKE